MSGPCNFCSSKFRAACIKQRFIRRHSNCQITVVTMGQSVSSQPSATTSSPPSSCPMHNSPNTPPAAKSSGGCPIDHSSPNAFNPANQMPNLPQTPISSQSVPLPTERTMSSIPRVIDDEAGTGSRQTWEYPSPQQFYNALVRKGMETPAEHVETVVEIHNFLNERAWGEVLKWEKRVAQCAHTHTYS